MGCSGEGHSSVWVGGRQSPTLKTQVLARVQQGDSDNFVLIQHSRSLQRHQIFMLRKPWKASANTSLGSTLLEPGIKTRPLPRLGSWRTGHSSQEDQPAQRALRSGPFERAGDGLAQGYRKGCSPLRDLASTGPAAPKTARVDVSHLHRS